MIIATKLRTRMKKTHIDGRKDRQAENSLLKLRFAGGCGG